ncbi:uncharacterized protein LOC108046489 isoform X2 [Drosophila rhopaloa]|uniref:Uncharacterized protein LOC108046489 isoform X2 n=1 Tax=Drosophila rhopaloa TaxID=1041015 RepID=A0A6P4EU61_DRORH|nr:uncharacterized protein LOC108046489 isoform X2 [Drosophila rhopaloa]
MDSTLLPISREQWPALRDLYASDRTNLTGFDLINYFINYKPSSGNDSIKIYTADKDWITHGSYILIHQLESKAYIYLDTVCGSLEDLGSLLCSLDLKVFHLICGYEERLKPLVEQYWLHLGQDLDELEHQGTIVYHLSKSKIPLWKPRSPHGSLSNLHVLPSHRRQGLGSLAVRFMAHEIKATGSEVLATVVFENKSSQKMFEKLDFKPINKLYWAVVPSFY